MHRRRGRRAHARRREPPAPAHRGPARQCRRRRPRPRAGQRRTRPEPLDQDLRDLRSREPGRPLDPDPRTRERRPTARRRSARSPSPTNCRAPPSNAGGTGGTSRDRLDHRGDHQLRDLQDHRDRDRPKPAASSASRSRSWSMASTPTDAAGNSVYSPALGRRDRADHARWCAPPSASTKPAATRSKSPTCSSPSGPELAAARHRRARPLRLHPRRPDATAPRCW